MVVGEKAGEGAHFFEWFRVFGAARSLKEKMKSVKSGYGEARTGGERGEEASEEKERERERK